MNDMSSPWESHLPEDLGALPLRGRLRRTDPAGPAPAPIAIVGLYPAHTRTALYRSKSGDVLKVPIEVEARTFDGSRSAKDVEERFLKPLGLKREQVFMIDIYPYFLANTAPSRETGRTMWDNVQTYRRETEEELAVKARPPEDTMLKWCRTLPGNVERIAYWFGLARPRLVMTLGNEVAAFLRGAASAREAQPHLYGHAVKMECFGWTARVVHCAHPGLFTRGDRSNAWAERHQRWCSTIGTAEAAAALRDC